MTDGVIEAHVEILWAAVGTGHDAPPHPVMRVCALCGLTAALIWAQPTTVVSLAEAQQIALRSHPRIASAEFTVQAGESVVKEVQAARHPSLAGNVTGVGAEHSSTVSAGAVTTSSLYSRGSTGVSASQLVTDFGRTGSLEESARLRNASQKQNVIYTRAEVLLEVRPITRR